MKRRTTIALATLFAASALGAPAFAGGLSVGVDAGAVGGIGADVGADAGASVGSDGVQADVGVTADAGAKTESGSPGVDTGTTASTSVDFDTALSAIGDESGAAMLRTMTEVSTVTVVDVSETSNADAAKLDSAIEENAAKIDDMRASLQSNAAVNAALEAEKVDASQVIAADVAADGSLTVFVE